MLENPHAILIVTFSKLTYLRKGIIMNNQYQPNGQMPPPYIPPQKPRVDPAFVKKQKTDAVNNLGDKIAQALKADPILTFIEKNSEIFSYIVTGICVLFSIILMSAGNFRIPFGVVSVVFGFFALSKKKLLPLAVAMSAVSLFSLICFIHSIAYMIQTVKYGFFGSVFGGALLGIFFSLLELAAVGFLTFIVWTYFQATLPPKPAPVQQPYYGQPQQPAQYGQNMQQPPIQPAQSVKPAAEPILDPIAASSAPATVVTAVQEKPKVTHKFCSACGTENSIDASFCKQCGNKF